MTLQVANNAYGELNADINDSVTTIVLKSGNGARFPSLTGSQYFYATLIDTNNNLEIVKATARSSDTLTVVRAQDGTSERAFSANDRIELRPVAAFFSTYQQKEASIDMNGTELILDVDADTSITADTDDQIDFKTGGTDRFKIQSTAGNNVVIADGLTLTDGNIIVANGHGIDFSATADGSSAGFSELFHDYEEGIFSCVLTPGSSGSITMNGSYNDGYYTKVGRLVTVFGDIRVSSVSSPSGDLRIALPFTVMNDSKARAIGNVLIYGLAKQTNQLGGFIVQANYNTALGLIGYQTDASTHVNLQTIGAGDEVKFTITYQAEE